MFKTTISQPLVMTGCECDNVEACTGIRVRDKCSSSALQSAVAEMRVVMLLFSEIPPWLTHTSDE